MIKEAPISFFFVCVLSVLLAFFIVRWMYLERLKNKDELIAHYREKLGLQPSGKQGATEEDKNKEVREQLIAFWIEGKKYTPEFFRGYSQETIMAIRAWAEKVETYLKEHLDSSYADRFHIQMTIPPDTESEKKLFSHIDNLEEFIKELAMSSPEK